MRATSEVREGRARELPRRLDVGLVVLLFYSLSCPALAAWERRPPAAELLKAPRILMGKVEALRYRGTDILPLWGPMEVEVHDASVVTRQVMRGENPGKAFLIKGLAVPTDPETFIGRQTLQRGSIYVFFLSSGDAANELLPIDPDEFAIETVEVPEDRKRDPPREALRRVAKFNIDHAGHPGMERWFDLLAQLYDREEDLEFLLRKTEDARPHVCGNALAVLCERNPDLPSLYAKAMRYVEVSASIGDLWSYRRRISQSLPQVVGEDKLTREVLEEWLSSDVAELQEVALGMVGDKRLTNEIVSLMRRTKNRNTQYDCIRALSAMWAKQGPGYREFMAKPDHYVNQWAVSSWPLAETGGDLPRVKGRGGVLGPRTGEPLPLVDPEDSGDTDSGTDSGDTDGIPGTATHFLAFHAPIAVAEASYARTAAQSKARNQWLSPESGIHMSIQLRSEP